MDRPSVYVETSVLSYLTGRASRDIQVLARQELTRRWWEDHLGEYEVFVSPAVLAEAIRGAPDAATRRLEALTDARVLGHVPEVDALADVLAHELAIPEKVAPDALHIAYAIHYEVDYLVTWNCAHIANAASLKRLAELVRCEGLWLPVVCTVAEMCPEEDEDDAS